MVFFRGKSYGGVLGNVKVDVVIFVDFLVFFIFFVGLVCKDWV